MFILQKPTHEQITQTVGQQIDMPPIFVPNFRLVQLSEIGRLADESSRGWGTVPQRAVRPGRIVIPPPHYCGEAGKINAYIEELCNGSKKAGSNFTDTVRTIHRRDRWKKPLEEISLYGHQIERKKTTIGGLYRDDTLAKKACSW